MEGGGCDYCGSGGMEGGEMGGCDYCGSGGMEGGEMGRCDYCGSGGMEGGEMGGCDYCYPCVEIISETSLIATFQLHKQLKGLDYFKLA